mmetsp:Transcript_1901/g.2657  ORF Transcript_1901/g.2657 Transcript_1901/m.2657 type:complete len:98 (+) Transcript_1901:2300-2593(+)
MGGSVDSSSTQNNNVNYDTRSAGTGSHDALTAADSASQGARTEAGNTTNNNESNDNSRFQIPTPLSSEEQKDSNIQFVEVQTLLFGENPVPLNPKTI